MSTKQAFRRRAQAGILVAVLGLAILVVFWGLSFHEIDLVHLVVVNSIVQKAPPDYPRDRIESLFQQARTEATESLREQQYLEKLLRLSQRLEKVQSLTPGQVDEILKEF